MTRARFAVALLLVVCVVPPAAAARKGKPARRTPAATPELPRSQPVAVDVKPDAADAKPAAVKPARTKVYTFTGLDVEGKLKTPQLLYFFDRVKLELDTTAQPRRSFIKELEATSTDKGL
jgi:hypothetical protein